MSIIERMYFCQTFLVDGKQGSFRVLVPRSDGGYEVEKESGTIVYYGESAKKFLCRQVIFHCETQIIVFEGTTVKVTVSGESFMLDENGAILIKPGSHLKVNLRGKVVVITTNCIPKGYKLYCSNNEFVSLYDRKGCNKTGLVWERDGVMIFSMQLKKNFWDPSQPTEWITDSMSLGTPIVGVSMVNSSDKNGIVDFPYLIRPAEALHLHPVRHDIEQTEVYIEIQGRMGIFVILNDKPHLCILNQGDMVIIRPETIHQVLVAKCPYTHVVLQIPSTFHYGLEFKQQVDVQQFRGLVEWSQFIQDARLLFDRTEMSGIFTL